MHGLAMDAEASGQLVRQVVKRGVPLRPQVSQTELQELKIMQLYIQQSQTLVEIAELLGVSAPSIRNVLIRRGVPRRPHVRRRAPHRGLGREPPYQSSLSLREGDDALDGMLSGLMRDAQALE